MKLLCWFSCQDILENPKQIILLHVSFCIRLNLIWKKTKMKPREIKEESSNDPPSKGSSFFKINPDMIPVKITYMGYQLGKCITALCINCKFNFSIYRNNRFSYFPLALGMSLPFLTLQMVSLGLTIEDVSICFGLLPLLSIGGIAAVGKCIIA